MGKKYIFSDEVPENPGAVLRKFRLHFGITQADLSYGYCSVSRYSRIESGKKLPSAEEFSYFMNLLQEKSSSLGEPMDDLYLYEESEEIMDRHSTLFTIWNESKLDRWEDAGDLISLYQKHFHSTNPPEIQSISFFELMHNYHVYDSFYGLTLCKSASELLRLTRPKFSLDRGRIDFHPGSVEFLLLNAIACGLLESNQEILCRKGIMLLSELIRITSQRKNCLYTNEIMAALMTNLCFFETELDNLNEAGRHFEMIPAFFTNSGGIYLYCKFLRCEYFYYMKRGLNEKCQDKLHAISQILSKMPNPPSVSAFMKNSPKIMVF